MAEPRRPIANRVGLAILGLLIERPMHPYDMVSTLHARGLDTVVKVRKASVYDTVRALERAGWIQATGTEQSGGRPERTVYTHTPQGHAGFVAWVDELIRVPEQEYPSVLTAVSYLGALGRQGAIDALTERVRALDRRIREAVAAEEAAVGQGVPPLFVLEVDYSVARMRAELDWARRTADRIAAGTLAWPTAVPPSPSSTTAGDH